MTTTIKRTPNRQAALTGLAVVGFITLIILGIMLAIYTARFVPVAASRVGSAAVYLSHVFSPAKDTDLQVVPQIPFDVATSTATSTVAASTTPAVVIPAHPVTTTPGTPTQTTYPAGGTQTTAPLYGKPDLQVTITQTGYLTTNNTNSFVSSKTVPNNERGAVKFTVTNMGTNVSGTWDFEAVLPTTSSYTFQSDTQESLRPGEKIDYVLGFDSARNGDREITVTIDPDHHVSESNESNNEDSATVTIK